MLWPDQKLMYDFYDVTNSNNTINHLENLGKYVMKIRWKRLILIWDNASSPKPITPPSETIPTPQEPYLDYHNY
jgi:hypothetical protein